MLVASDLCGDRWIVVTNIMWQFLVLGNCNCTCNYDCIIVAKMIFFSIYLYFPLASHCSKMARVMGSLAYHMRVRPKAVATVNFYSKEKDGRYSRWPSRSFVWDARECNHTYTMPGDTTEGKNDHYVGICYMCEYVMSSSCDWSRHLQVSFLTQKRVEKDVFLFSRPQKIFLRFSNSPIV